MVCLGEYTTPLFLRTSNDHKIGAITGMSPEMITRYSRFADQKMLAKAAAHRLEKANTQ
jgi:hypothetical protein